MENNFFDSLFDGSGVERSSQKDLENILVDFYKCLFTNDVLDMQVQTKIIDALKSHFPTVSVSRLKAFSQLTYYIQL